MKSLLTTLLVIVVSSAAFAHQGQDEATVAGLVCERTHVNRTVIQERNIDVSDWTIRVTNKASEPRWIRTVAEKSSSAYLIQRNPKQITYRVMTLEGSRWRDTFMGFSTIVGPQDTWLKIAPNESFEFIVPVFDGFDSNPAQVRLEFYVSSDVTQPGSQELLSDTFVHFAKGSDAGKPSAPSAPNEPAEAAATNAKQTPQEAVAAMNKLLVKRDFQIFYRTHCHQHMRDQVDEERFVEVMTTVRGLPLVKLFAEVQAAIETRRGPDVLISQPQENPDEYEFILVKISNLAPRKGHLWHLELQLEDGKWKLMDTD